MSSDTPSGSTRARRPRGPRYLRSAPVCEYDRRALGPGDEVVQAPCGHLLHAACAATVRRNCRDCACSCSRATRLDDVDQLRRWRIPGAPAPVQLPPICTLDDRPFASGDETLQLPCAHVFHRVCIARFWANTDGVQCCPTDGRPVASGPGKFAMLRTWTVPVEGNGEGNGEEDAMEVEGDEEAEMRRMLKRIEAVEMKAWKQEQMLILKKDQRLLELSKRLLKERTEFMERRDRIIKECALVERAAEKEELCVVDHEIIERGDVVIRLPCFHVFHEKCLVPYLKKENSPKCPIDRTRIDKADVDRLPVWQWNMTDGEDIRADTLSDKSAI